MPFVVDWTPVNALGSLAMSAGAAQGTAIGNRDFLQRQGAADAQAAEYNQRNRELGFAAQQAPAQQMLAANIQQQQGDRRFDQALALEDRRTRGDLQQEAIRQQGKAQGDQFDLIKQAAGISQRQEAEFQYEQMKKEQAKRDYFEARTRMGIPPEQIQSELDQVEYNKTNKTGSFAPGGQQATGLKANNEYEELGLNAAYSGQASSYTPEAILAISAFKQVPEQVVTANLYSGAMKFYSDPRNCSLQQVQQAAADPNQPEWARKAAQMAIPRRNDVRFGANQAPSVGGAPDYSKASPEELMNAAGRLAM